MKTIIFKIILFLLVCFSFIQEGIGQTDDKLFFEENKGQWTPGIQYKVDLPGTRLFLEKDKFTFVKYSLDDLEKRHDSKHSGETESHKKNKNTAEDMLRLHSFQATFINSNANVTLVPEKRSNFYSNYFIGNDPKKWASEVYSYEKIIYKDLYQNIDLAAYSKEEQLKYDFIIQAGADPEQIRIRYDGAEQLYLKNNTLIIKTSIGDIVESIPLAYQNINNKQVNVSCFYRLNDNNTITFYFPNGYNSDYSLVIDPILVAATYSGAPSSTTTYGHCATYDNAGNIYTGGECFDPGYPASAGAYQVVFAGSVDIAISKLNPAGSNLIWATYLGGNDGEIPNSLFVNNSQEIYVLGATASSNYPVSAGCYDNSYNAMNDIVITHLNATGTALAGSTYMGGNGDDGWAYIFAMNGHDGMRGEIIVDQANNAWVTSYTGSLNFPTTAGAYDQTHNGGTMDACVFKLSSNLSSLLWSSFLGGTGEDYGYGLRLNTLGEVYVTGHTSDNTFPSTAGAYMTSYQGGPSDGYLAKFNASGSALLASTYIGVAGTTATDISYFIDIDKNDDPYIFGASTNVMPVTAGVYSNAGSGNFISKFNQNLTGIVYSTVVGSGAAGYLEPEAFMIDTCENVYIAGFGSTAGYPITSTALYSTQAAANNGNCYLMVLSKDATSLLYGSFYFGNHVDGGTSRFDTGGSIYLGICMGAPAVTPAWAWKDATAAPGWDMFVLKMDFQLAGVNAVANASPNDTICLGQSVTFNNTSNGVDYTWDFGDGSSIDTTASPTYTYTLPGTYTVIFHAIDSSSCNIMDSTLLTITVLPVPDVVLGNDTLICGAISMTLDAGIPGAGYSWSTGANTQTININTAGTYWVVVNNGACTDADTIVIQSTVLVPPFGNDSTLCTGQTIVLDAENPGTSYLWSTGATTQTILASSADSYWVTISLGACSVSDTMIISYLNYPIVDLRDSILCPGSSLVLDAGNTASSYLWSTGAITQTITAAVAGTYIVTAANNQCTTSDTSHISFVAEPNFSKDISLCEVTSYTLDAGVHSGTYLWSTGATTQTIDIAGEGEYWVEINTHGCIIRDTAIVTGFLGGGALFCPNAFTPNENNLNDRYTAYGSDITYFHLSIFDRWGELIFETEDTLIGWDGKYKGELVKQDVYVWKIQFKSRCNLALTERMGHVTVVR